MQKTRLFLTLLVPVLASCDKSVVSDQRPPSPAPSDDNSQVKPIHDGPLAPAQQGPVLPKAGQQQTGRGSAAEAVVPVGGEQKSLMKISAPACSGERVTSFLIKSEDIDGGKETLVRCGEPEKAIGLNAAKDKCVSLNITAQVFSAKENRTYFRSSKLEFDKNFFQIENIARNSSSDAGVRMKFEDMSTEYWNDAWAFCKANPTSKVALVPSTLKVNQPCGEILQGYQETDGASPDVGKFIPPAIDWKDFVLSVTSADVGFTVEGFPESGCKKQ